MEWTVLLIIGFILLCLLNLFAKIGWYNFDNLNGNENTWEKDDKKKTISGKALRVYRAIGIVLVAISLIMLSFILL